jgi:Spy/CpxP family protein refolding chaperone
MRVCLLALILIASPSLALAAPAPASRPAPQQPPAGAGPGVMLDRTRQAIEQLRLTPEQKSKIDAIFKEARAELEQMKTQLESMDMRQRMAEAREFLDGLRADLAFVLTPEQREQMQQKLEQLREGGPGGGPGGGGMPPPGMIAERLREAIPKLMLSDEQATRVKELFDDLRPRADALRQQIEMGNADAREKARELAEESRQKLREILTPEQQETLRDLMRQSPPAAANDAPRGRGPGANRRNRDGASTRAAAGADKSDQMSDMTMSGAGGDMMSMEGAAGAAARRGNKPAAPGEAPDPTTAKPGASAPGPAIGDPAPDFTLNKPDGAQVSLASMKGRVIVLVFGSYSAPTFRNRAAALEKLRSDLGIRATFFIVYSREAHPSGEWEVARNKEDGISVEQARSMDARKSAATTAREKLKLATPILLDTIGNDTALAYGAGINSAYVIGRDGKIAARQQWFEPLALRRAIENAANVKPATRPAP